MKPPSRKRHAPDRFSFGESEAKKQKSPAKNTTVSSRSPRSSTRYNQNKVMATPKMSTDEEKTVKTNPPEFGLISKDKAVAFVESKIHVTIQGFMANVESKLTYVNNETDPIDVRYIFPIDDMSAVYKFEADINEKHIVAEIQDKQQAKVTYVEAVSSGRTGMLLSEGKSAGDVFKCQLGNLHPGETAQLTMAYVVELTVESDGVVKFDLPVVLNPRYIPRHAADEDMDTSSEQSEKPAKMTFTAAVMGHHKIRNIISDTEGFICKINKDRVTATIELDDDLVLDKDFSFSVTYNEIDKPGAILEKGDPTKDGLLKEDIIMINFMPDLRAKTKSAEREFIFLMDRSASMTGTKIQKSSAALFLFLKSLPVGCLFNIVSFGSNHNFLFKKSKPYNKDNLEEALNLQKSMNADMGGTEILTPLSSIFSKQCIHDYPRQVFMLTDGEVGNTAEVTSLVGRNANNSRVFTFGIGSGCSTSLIKNVAKAGNGTATFIKDDTDNMKAKIITALQHSMEDCMTNIDLDWKLPKGYTTIKIPTQIPCIMEGDMAVMFAVLRSNKPKKNLSGALTVKGVTGKQKFSHTIDFKMPATFNTDLPLHCIAAKRQIKELELEECAIKDSDEALGFYRQNASRVGQRMTELNEIKQKIILVSKSANVISKYTSFVGVDMELRKQGKDQPLHASLTIKVLVKRLTGKVIQIDISSQSLVEDLKEAIREEEGVPPDQQRLIFHGVQLEDGRTLDDYAIGDNSVLHLVLRLRGGGGPLVSPTPHFSQQNPIQNFLNNLSRPPQPDSKSDEDDDDPRFKVFVKTLTGKTVTVFGANKETTVLSFKVVIQNLEGIPVDQQRLIFAGMQLEDHHSLEDYNITSKSTLHLILRLRGGGGDVEHQPPPPPIEPQKSDDMLKLIDLQSFDGCWTYSTELVDIIKVTNKLLQENKAGYQQNVWCTAIAVCFLKKMFGERSDEWTMIVDKAMSWLNSQKVKNIQQLLDIAAKTVDKIKTK